LLVGLALYFWTLMGLFMYFHSTNYSTVGLLLAVFGAQGLLKPCANEDTVPTGFTSIVNVTVAIVVMTVVDMLLSPARASDLAKANFKKAYGDLVEALSALFDPTKEVVDKRGGALNGAIGAAESMGNEASMEPRYWRHDWPTDKYNKGIACLKTLRFCLDSIEKIMLEDNGKKKGVFEKAISLKAFCDLKEILLTHTTKVMETVEQAVQDIAAEGVTSYDVFVETARLKGIDKEEMKARQTFDTVWRDALEAVFKALNVELFGEKADPSRTFFSSGGSKPAPEKLEDISEGPLAECSLLVESLKAMFEDLDATLETLAS
jgi:hypothetical protein